ncbi:MAG: 4Fe-4S dicluster domain-containing protein [Candidatus Brocadiia bacterium]
MEQRLQINLDICRECEDCTATCGYPYHHPNNGVARLRELAAQELTCRQCEVQSCVLACPNDALEKDEDGILRRYNMRCTGCLSCSVACPFGTLIPAALEFRDSFCDACADRGEGELPECARTCPEDAIVIGSVDEDEENVHLLGENLAVRSLVWQKKEPAESK